MLQALQRATAAAPASQRLPLRQIATQALGGDPERAARALSELDVAGYVKTDIMGWRSGWLTSERTEER